MEKNPQLSHQTADTFLEHDPHLVSLSKMKYQYQFTWYNDIDLDVPGIYILTGGRQLGKSTSTKQLIYDCLKNQHFDGKQIGYLTCDEIYDPQSLSQILRTFLEPLKDKPFLIVVDEITYVKDWDRVIKALADEGFFANGICLLTGSDALILTEAAMRFPGRRGNADKTDFTLHPLSFSQYTALLSDQHKSAADLFQGYLHCGGYLRAINDQETQGHVRDATYQTYEQWIRGDFKKEGKREQTLVDVLDGLLNIGVSQISYSSLTANIGSISKDTCISYIDLLERMGVLMRLQAFDQNKLRGFPKKDQKFHFKDPFIARAMYKWVYRERNIQLPHFENNLVEAVVASHAERQGRTFYFKGKGEIDVILVRDRHIKAIEVKWANQIRPADLKSLTHFDDAIILTKNNTGQYENIQGIPVYDYLLKQ